MSDALYVAGLRAISKAVEDMQRIRFGVWLGQHLPRCERTQSQQANSATLAPSSRVIEDGVAQFQIVILAA